MIDDAHLSEQLIALAERLTTSAPVDENGAAELTALLPCEPAVGPVAVVCWQSQSGETLYELARLDGTRLDDTTALRESLVLLAMMEALEQQLAPLTLRDLIDGLIEWQTAVREARESGYTPGMVEQDEITTQLWRNVELLQQIQTDVGDPDDEPRMAGPQRLDRLGGQLRELERTWEALESAAATWIDAVGDAESPLVGKLWTTLALARRGPLAAPVSAVIEDGRRAGAALAEEVIAGA